MKHLRHQVSTAIAFAMASFGAPADRVLPTENYRRTEFAQHSSQFVAFEVPYTSTANTAEILMFVTSGTQPQQDRATTPLEEIIGEVRSWILLGENWDGEGARRAQPRSIVEAILFLDLLPEQMLPEPMLLASGHTALYWNDEKRYADLEFLGDGRVTYYIEDRKDGKHKGIVRFREGEMPAVFSALLET